MFLSGLFLYLAGVLALRTSNALSKATFQAHCTAFSPQLLYPNSTLFLREFIPAGTNLSLPDNVVSCNRASQVVQTDLCRLALSIPTSKRSSITFEAWFPQNWTGRFLATGNGGVDGCIKYEDLAYGSSHGFATVGANNGHNGTSGAAFYQNADIVEDFVWRSLHTATAFGKRLVKAFYGKSHTKSYYLGCSLGGRQGIDAAERNPSDFDGIVAGAPAANFNLLYAWRGSFFPKTGAATDKNFINGLTWKTLLHDEVLRQCDLIDGAKDGIIEDPSLCSFDPGRLLCRPNQPAASGNVTVCLNAVQVKIVKSVFEPLRDGEKLLIPGMQPGCEIAAADGFYNGKPFPYTLDWYKYVVYDPSWNGSRMLTEDALAAEKLNPFNIRTYPRSLQVFADRGGKMLTFHGQQDNQITGANSIALYNHLRGGVSKQDELDAFYRMFRISGMGHCNSGPGAWVLGQGGNAAATGVPFEPKTNVLAALIAWVENGRAPETMTGTKFVNDTVNLGIDYQRRHCRYPKRNTFLGGDPKHLNNWVCK